MEAIATPESPPTADRPGLGRADIWVVAGLIGLGVVLPVVVGLVSGSLDMPRNDDWTFRRIALGLYQTGRFELNGFEAMTVLGQILLAQPFLWLSRGETWGLSIAGIAFATLAIISGYLLVRRFLAPVSGQPVSYRLLLFTGVDQPLYLYRLSGPGCPP